MQSFCMFIGRILMSCLFLTATYWHVTHWSSALAKIQASGIHYPDFVLIASTILLLLGGISLLFGYLTRVGSIFLIIAVVLSAVLFHPFWEFSGEEMQRVLLLFLIRMAVCGGLFVLLGTGPGAISIDARILRKKGV